MKSNSAAAGGDVERPRFRWWFLPSWLGLDAPCVVSVWLWAISRALGQPVDLASSIALFCAVWAVYLADRLIDVARCGDWVRATGRLRFGRRFRPLFAASLLVCLAVGASLGLTQIPEPVLLRGLAVGIGVTGYFLIFVAPVVFRRKPPGKELGVGLFFALGVWAELGSAADAAPLLIGFGLLAALNCLAIGARDAEPDRANDPGGASRWWRTIDRDLTVIGLGLTAVATAAALGFPQTVIFISLAAGSLALTLLHLAAKTISADAVRALADFCLLTPLAVFPWL